MINELASKSKGLKKVMQPRMAYKYAPPSQRNIDNSSDPFALKKQGSSNYQLSPAHNTAQNNHFESRSRSLAMYTHKSAADPNAPRRDMLLNNDSGHILEDSPIGRGENSAGRLRGGPMTNKMKNG